MELLEQRGRGGVITSGGLGYEAAQRAGLHAVRRHRHPRLEHLVWVRVRVRVRVRLRGRVWVCVRVRVRVGLEHQRARRPRSVISAH